MLFGSHTSNLVLLNPEYLTIYTDYGSQSVKFNFPQGSVVNQDVIDTGRLNSALVELFKNIVQEKKFLLVLGKDLVFYKQFSPPIANASDIRIAELIDQMPFERDKIKIRVINDNGISRAMAINHKVPEVVFQAAKDAGIRVVATVPLLAFGNKSETLSDNQVRSILENVPLISTTEILHPERQLRNQIFGILIWIFVATLVCATVVAAALLTKKI